MKKKWTIGDVVDLEYLLEQDRRVEDQGLLEQRDRCLYLEKIAPLLPRKDGEKKEGKPLRMVLVRLWISAMGQSFGILPGALVDSAMGFLRGVLLAGGVVTGLLVCLSLFSYTGRLPLNISYFFGVLLLPQTLLLFITLAGLLLMRIRPDKGLGFGIYPVLGLVAARATAKLFHQTLARLTRQKQEALRSVLGNFRRSSQAHGHLFLWPLFVLMQLFGVGFNLGVLGATLLRVAFFDTAFGWQSTLNLSHDFVYRVVSMVALPWSWAFPGGGGFPTGAQIQGTRLILKDGIYPLATTDLVSWWPFLCLTVVVYALIPRAFLLVLGLVAQERSLNSYPLDGWAVQKLVNRLVTPAIATDPVDLQESSPTLARKKSELRVSEPLNKGSQHQDGCLIQGPGELESAPPFLALVHDDIFDLFNTNEFKQRVYLRLNRRVDTILRIGLDESSEIKAVAGFSGATAGMVMLQEAWMPPIREVLNFILSLRRNAGKNPLVVVLVGKPGPDSPFTVPNTQDRKIWTMKINGLGDPLIHLEDLVQS